MAALTSSVSIIEPIVAYFIDEHRILRVPACIGVALAAFLAGIPAAWSFGGANLGSLFGMTPFDLMDYVTLNFMMPVNVLATCLLMGWAVNPTFVHELFLHRSPGASPNALPAWVRYINFSCRFIAPIGITAILLGSFFL